MTPDIFFVSADEPDADRNWSRIQRVAPRARRIREQPSIRAAYLACAEASRTPHFFMVDGDNWLLDGFTFALDAVPRLVEVAVWRARNPVNGLVYGNGGIKLLPAAAVREALSGGGIDVGTSIGSGHRKVDVVASEHRFNTSAFAAWRTAFRECVKLSADLIRDGDRTIAAARLDIWCADGSVDPAPAYAEQCVAGARDGRAFGQRFAGQAEALARINDYAWLRRMWEARREGVPASAGESPR